MCDLSKVTIGIKSFIRFKKLDKALEGIEDSLPECKVIVADDSFPSHASTVPVDYRFRAEKCRINMYETNPNIRILFADFDSGFGYKSNVIAQAVQTPYLLVGSDDFDFSPMAARKGIIELVRVLDTYPNISIASGRVDNRRYEFILIESNGVVTEIPAAEDDGFGYVVADLTVNYSLIRREVLRRVQWDNDVKIGGGEHGAFFLDCKRAGFNTVYVPGVNINTQRGRDSEEYRKYRNRALSPERPCFAKRRIKKYVLGDGRVDYDESITGR